ncbi:Fur family transcriptional regulator [Treponema sp.]|jgi:Fur family ferric uptake transcriptional regulator|uniref:Fur family transcriptional regulator n=1 Tax=Treponema sp. TaxID=166 RepID=UPI0025D030C9|nr:transcriptional repressor [Treponema sp.]MBQ7537615.1 transcriptional repressor [Treponema sp.]MBR4321661.1 transcriptional repressor [Treponema sp.]
MTYNTEQRTALLSFLTENPDKTFSAKQIAEALAGKNISKSSVYRNIAELESEQKIKRVTKAGCHESFYQFCDNSACKNHIHLSCTKCGKIFHMESEQTERLVSDVEAADGFEINRAETTLYGLCRDCGKN